MSKIEWTEQTWNPVVGCRRVSAGCDNCYAIKEAHRKATIFPHYAEVTERNEAGAIDWTGRFNVAPDHIMNKPLRTKAPTTFFVNSMSDLFGEGVSDETIKRVFEVMERTPRHRYQVLTKRPNRAVRLASSLPWPEHVWMGVSIEEDKFVARADLLRRIPAKTRFISAEPLLGPLPSLDLINIDWLIAGGESGHSRHLIRPMEADWVRDLRDRCVGAGTAFFFKQWGNYDEFGVWHRAKKDAGRELDGRLWDEMPIDKSVSTLVMATPPTREWASIGEFRAELAYERAVEKKPPSYMDQSPRLTLREPIWRRLMADGPLAGAELRKRVLTDAGLDAGSPRVVNLHAWALVDLQKRGFVVGEPGVIAGKRGRTRSVTLYRATKPRVRVRAV